MLRISATQRSQTTTLKLEGKLLEPWVSELRLACDRAALPLEGISLDLSGVTFVDAVGAAYLQELIRGGAGVSACSGFVAELLGLQLH
jgi:ABC-type transporter Mla MlaB component